MDNADITSSATGTGAAGIIDMVGGGSLTLENGSSITSTSAGAAAAGSINLLTSDTTITGGSSISTSLAKGDAAVSGGSISLTGSGSFRLLDDSSITSTTSGRGDAGRIGIVSGGIKIDSATINSSATGTGKLGKAGKISLEATGTEPMTLASTVISSRSSTSIAENPAGSISIKASELRFDGSSLDSSSSGASPSGSISLNVGTLSLPAGSSIKTTSSGNPKAGTNRAGTITIAAASLATIDGEISSESSGTGQAGVIDIAAGQLNASGLISTKVSGQPASNDEVGQISIKAAGPTQLIGATITSSTTGSGRAGDIGLTFADALISGSSISSSTSATGQAGTIAITAARLELFRNTNNAAQQTEINSSTSGAGAGGNILLTADRLNLGAGTFVRTNSSGTAGEGTNAAGTIGLVSKTAATIDGEVSSDSSRSGQAGKVTINANDLTMHGTVSTVVSGQPIHDDPGRIAIIATGATELTNATVTSSTTGAGDAGSIQLTLAGATIDGTVISSTTGPADANGLRSTGRAGDIALDAAGHDVTLKNGTRIETTSASTSEGSNAGTIAIHAGTLTLVGSADPAKQVQINSSTSGAGKGGSVALTASQMTIGAGAAISTNSSGSGSSAGYGAGAISLKSTGLITLDGLVESNATAGNGRAGIVTISSTDLTASGTVSTNTSGTRGDGAILIESTGKARLSGAQFTSTTDSAGDAGAITFRGGGVLALDHAKISSSTEGAGKAGSVEIDMGRTDLVDSSIKTTTTTGGSPAGTIAFSGDGDLTLTRSTIASSTTGAGNAGLITLALGSAALDDLSSITTSAGDDTRPLGAFGAAGEITLTASGPVTIAGGSSIVSTSRSTVVGNGAGNITVVAPSLALTAAQDVRGGAGVPVTRIDSSSFGAGKGGTIKITAGTLTLPAGTRISTNSEGTLEGIGANDAGNIELASAGLIDFGGEISSASSGTGAAGTVTIAANRLTGSGRISTQTSGPQKDPERKGAILVTATGRTTLDGATITSSTNGAGNAGDVSLTLSDTFVRRGQIASQTGAATPDASGATGRAGNIELIAPGHTITLSDGAVITSRSDSSLAESPAGNVTIMASELTLSGEATQINSVTTGPGKGGNISLTAPLIDIGQGTLVSTNSSGKGSLADYAAGNILLDASGGLVTVGGTISSETSGNGFAGKVTVLTKDLTATGTISTKSAGLDSKGLGQIDIVSTGATILNGAGVTSSTIGSGTAGTIAVTGGGTLTLTNGASISSSTDGAGEAGTVTLAMGKTLLEGASSITTSTSGVNRAGRISVASGGPLTLVGGSAITSSTTGAGEAGTIDVNAQDIAISGSRIASEAKAAKPGELGPAGSVTLTAIGAISLDGQSAVTSSSNGLKQAGNIKILAGKLTLDGQSQITSESLCGPGNCAFRPNAVLSLAATPSDGQATGSIDVAADVLSMDGGSTISTSTMTATKAGIINIATRELHLTDGASIASQADQSAAGSAGQVTVRSALAQIASGSRISTSSAGTGDAGSILLDGDDIALDGGEISSSATGTNRGASGDIGVTSRSLRLQNGGQIATSSSNPDPAGTITVRSASILISDDGSAIQSENRSSGPAGQIQINTDALHLASGGTISTNSVGGAAGDIEILMPRTSILVLDGTRDQGVITTSSGASTGGRITISDPFLILSNGGRILALGSTGGANVRISSDFFIRSADRLNQLSVDGGLVLDSQVGDLSAGAELPDLSFLDASSVLRGQCRSGGGEQRASTLLTKPVGPYSSQLPRAPTVSARQTGTGACL